MDEQIFYFVNGATGRGMLTDFLIVFCAEVLPLVILGGLFALIVIRRRQWFSREGIALLAGGIAWGTAHLLKEVVASPRPFLELPHVIWLIDYGGYDSFPSGHAMLFGAIAAVLWYRNRTEGFLLALAALLIGVARIMAGIHWPVDIIAGYILGGIIGAGVYYCYRSVSSRAR